MDQDDVLFMASAMGSSLIERNRAVDSVYYNFFATGEELYATSENAAPYIAGSFVKPQGASDVVRVGLVVKRYDERPVPQDGFKFQVYILGPNDSAYQDVGRITAFCYADYYAEASIEIPGLEAGLYKIKLVWVEQLADTAIQVLSLIHI